MYQEDVVDLFWSTFFNCERDAARKREIVKLIKSATAENYQSTQLVNFLDLRDIQPHDDAYTKACEAATLSFCLEYSNFAREFLSEENHDKALNLFKRKQYSGNVCKELLAKFVALLTKINVDYDYDRRNSLDRLRDLLRQDIVKVFKALRDEQVEKSFSELKKKIETISSGVKSHCYFEAEKKKYREKALNDELNDFVVNKYGYNLNSFNRYEIERGEIYYKNALLNSEKFWKEHEKFDVFAFTNSIFDLNGAKHAQKVLSFIFDTIIKDEIAEKLIKGNLSLSYINREEFIDTVENNTFNIAFRRFGEVYDLEKIKDEIICYPLLRTPSDEKKIAKGREIIECLFDTIYPADSQRVLTFFKGQLTGDEPYYVNNRYSVKDLFLSRTFGYWYEGENSSKYKVAEIYCPEFFSAENTLNRLYLTAYAALQLENNVQKCYSNLFEIYYDLFKVVEKKFGLKTSFQRNTAGREQAYGQLKETLKSYGVEISDKFKNDYIISLLDRKVAVMDESERFPVLEQLGDAIYGFAVAEMMFYQSPEIEEDSIFKEFNKYVSADTQVEIARKIGIDKLYISSLTLSYKYTRDTLVKPDEEIFLLKQEIYGHDCKFKFIADSLEMIIGTICREHGYQAAINFTKKIVKDTYPETFGDELRWDNERDMSFDREAIDWEFFNRIKPAPFLDFSSYRSKDHLEKMWDALNKFMIAYSIGTENVSEREFITNHYSHMEYGDELYGINFMRGFDINSAMFEYLHIGLAYVMQKYVPRIKENYEILKKSKNK